MKKILLIGAGPTSSLIAYNLRQLEKKFSLEIHVWEKARGVGGRFATSRSPFSPECTADLGAQYLTHNLSNTWAAPYFEVLRENGLIKKFSTEKMAGFRNTGSDVNEDFVCTQGTASIVKFFLQQSNVEKLTFSKRVTMVEVDANGKVVVGIEGSEEKEMFDAVVSTMPVPQILQLQGIDALLSQTGATGLAELLAQVEYSSRYALGLFFKKSLQLNPDEKAANFVNGDPKVRYWSLEDAKRQLGESSGEQQNASGSAVVIHTSVPFAIENLDKDLKDMEKILVEHSKKTIKTLNGAEADHAKCQRWRYSQVTKGFVDCPGFAKLSTTPPVIVAGDGFTYSGIQGCILSAEKTVDQLKSWLQSSVA